ncbi:MAG: hypothetical protein COA78_22115 [Blastopirellula sp.]|nr:MAG: hypothetical protein COA78_22115 [Blastopirellula sp.]
MKAYFKISTHTKNLIPVVPNCDTTDKWIEAAARYNDNHTKANHTAMLRAWSLVRKEILHRMEDK